MMENKAVLTSLIKPYKKILTFPAHATILKRKLDIKTKGASPNTRQTQKKMTLPAHHSASKIKKTESEQPV